MLKQIAICFLLALPFYGNAKPLCAYSTANYGIEIDSYTWDFGRILESDGIVSHTFVLTNTTSESFQIATAVPSCSCTYVSYPKNAIAPGERGEIEVRFSPSGIVGKVFREVQLFDHRNTPFATLEISADVVPADRSIAERYPFALAPFLYSSLNNVTFGYVFHGTESTKLLYLANASDKPMHLGIATSDPNLTVSYPEVLQPKVEAEILLTYATPDNPELFAYVTDTLRLEVNGEQAPLPITVSATLLAPVVQRENAPWMRTVSYGSEIVIHNDGVEDLVIHHVQAPESIAHNIAKGTRVVHGESVKLTLSGSGTNGFSVWIFSNDPLRPAKEIRIE